MRQGLEKLLDTVTGLAPGGSWNEEQWQQLRESTLQVVRGNEGVAYLAEAVTGYAAEAGVDVAATLRGE